MSEHLSKYPIPTGREFWDVMSRAGLAEAAAKMLREEADVQNIWQTLMPDKLYDRIKEEKKAEEISKAQAEVDFLATEEQRVRDAVQADMRARHKSRMEKAKRVIKKL